MKLKEKLRNLATRLRLQWYAILPRRSRFEHIYRRGLWSGGEGTRSGAGSSLQATEDVRKQLPAVLRELETSKLLDVGCGDFHWMKEVDLPCAYLGVDIVREVIAENARQWGCPGIEFDCVDAVSEQLPSDCDATLCREVLFHLSFEDGLSLLANLKRSGVRHLIATTNTDIETNRDIVSGSFRNLNLEKPPFDFPAPKLVIQDGAISSNRILGVWAVADLG